MLDFVPFLESSPHCFSTLELKINIMVLDMGTKKREMAATVPYHGIMVSSYIIHQGARNSRML
jgi:hypothetical protein